MVNNFTRFYGRSPYTAEAEDLRRYQLHLVEQGVSRVSLNAQITGLKFFFEVTLDRREAMKKMRHVNEPRTLPEVLSVEEVTRLLQAAGSRKYQAALDVAYGAGLRASEVVHLKVPDIDSERRVVHVEQGQGKERPLRYALTGAAATVACLVAPGSGTAQAAPRGLAVSNTLCQIKSDSLRPFP